MRKITTAVTLTRGQTDIWDETAITISLIEENGFYIEIENCQGKIGINPDELDPVVSAAKELIAQVEGGQDRTGGK